MIEIEKKNHKSRKRNKLKSALTSESRLQSEIDWVVSFEINCSNWHLSYAFKSYTTIVFDQQLNSLIFNKL